MKKRMVLEFYRIFIEDFIIGDLEELSLITPNPITGLRGCTIPTAMTIISSMDLLGLLLNEDGKANDSSGNISYLIKFENQMLFPEYNDEDIEKIWNYRHGMMHHFFPKFKGNFAGICKNDDSQDLFVSNPIDGNESLNVSKLLKDFLEAIKKLKHFIENDAAESVYDSIIDHLKNLDYYLDLATQTTTYTTVNPGTPRN